MTTTPARLRKAVLPVAGLGTRVLPGTKTTPKELLNVVDRPILSYIVEEAREAGIEHIVFVTGRSKEAIEDYFDHQIELEAQLEAKGKTEILAAMNAELASAGEMSFTRQMQPKGLGHAVWCAKDIIGDEPFAVILPDVIVDAAPGAISIHFKPNPPIDPMAIIHLIQKNRAIKLAGNDKLRIERALPEPRERAQLVRDVLRSLGQPVRAAEAAPA